jgi:hypothetical protein
MSFWLVIGIVKPKKLPFFQVTENRVIMVLIYIGFVYTLFMGIIIIETNYYKRDAINALTRNGIYLARFFKNIHPFNGDSYSLKSTAAFLDNTTAPSAAEVQSAEHLPPIHKVTLTEVKEEFPEKEPVQH